MAEQDERSMIGYDPLAWMHDNKPAETDDPPPQPLETKINDDSASVEQESDLAIVDTDLSEVEAIHTEDNPETLTAALDIEHSAEPEDELAYPDSASSSTAGLTLNASQTIQNVGELHEQLQRLLDTGNKIDIDASAVAQIDTATLQLLLVLKLTATKVQKEVNIDFPSERFLEAANLLGVAEMLSVDQAASGFF